MKTVKAVKTDKETDIMLRELSRKHPKYAAMWLIGIHTGLRVSDILPLKVGDIRKREFEIIEKKTQKPKKIKIDDALYTRLNALFSILGLNDENYVVFSKTQNRPLSRVQAYRVMQKIGQKYFPENSIGTHSMRKTYAYQLFRECMDMGKVQEALNHKYQSTTMRYLLDESDFKKLFS